MRNGLGQRTLIIGNSGAGKSTLAQALAISLDIPAIDLDLLHWEEGGRGRKRDEEMARRLVREAAERPQWVIEGVFGWLAEVAFPRATALIWLDLPWEACHEGLVSRGLKRSADAQDSADLLRWAEAYWTRCTPSSFAGHFQLFESYAGPKLRLRSRVEIEHLVRSLGTERETSN